MKKEKNNAKNGNRPLMIPVLRRKRKGFRISWMWFKKW